ncbi:hypothetical protein MUK42_14883 [Musa troglodytarum]|uniref:Uncharacterized protein n=1 Tax=Musa troglodytarum TaxID=320322 RepID=A0A9E7L477_9LILI|nr:hypothetical protein MUK42_14883 [Musa troglodytarum]
MEQNKNSKCQCKKQDESVATYRAKRTDRKTPTWDAQFDREPRSDQILIKVPRIDGLREMDRLGRQRETDERVWNSKQAENGMEDFIDEEEEEEEAMVPGRFSLIATQSLERRLLTSRPRWDLEALGCRSGGCVVGVPRDMTGQLQLVSLWWTGILAHQSSRVDYDGITISIQVGQAAWGVADRHHLCVVGMLMGPFIGPFVGFWDSRTDNRSRSPEDPCESSNPSFVHGEMTKLDDSSGFTFLTSTFLRLLHQFDAIMWVSAHARTKPSGFNLWRMFMEKRSLMWREDGGQDFEGGAFERGNTLLLEMKDVGGGEGQGNRDQRLRQKDLRDVRTVELRVGESNLGWISRLQNVAAVKGIRGKPMHGGTVLSRYRSSTHCKGTRPPLTAKKRREVVGARRSTHLNDKWRNSHEALCFDFIQELPPGPPSARIQFQLLPILRAGPQPPCERVGLRPHCFLVYIEVLNGEPQELLVVEVGEVEGVPRPSPTRMIAAHRARGIGNSRENEKRTAFVGEKGFKKEGRKEGRKGEKAKWAISALNSCGMISRLERLEDKAAWNSTA